MTREERKSRIIARGEVSGHMHAIVGEGVKVLDENGETIIMVEKSAEDVKLRHLLEGAWLNDGTENWTGEHHDIDLLAPELEVGTGVRHGDVYIKKIGEGKYKYIAQKEFDPFEKRIREVMD